MMYENTEITDCSVALIDLSQGAADSIKDQVRCVDGLLMSLIRPG